MSELPSPALQAALDAFKKGKKMTADPDLELNTDGNTDNRLIPLDPWERQWIAGALRHAIALSPLDMTSSNDAKRMEDLLAKMRFRNVPIEPN